MYLVSKEWNETLNYFSFKYVLFLIISVVKKKEKKNLQSSVIKIN